VGARALGKDVENQAGPPDHPALEQTLKVALLAGRECVVEQREIGLLGCHALGDFLRLARSDEEPGIGLATRAADHRQHLGAGRACEFQKLLTVGGVIRARQLQMDQNRALAGFRPLKHQPGLSSSGAASGDSGS
jgi:hypothetical protein